MKSFLAWPLVVVLLCVGTFAALSLGAGPAPAAIDPLAIATRASALVFDKEGHGSGVVIGRNLVLTAGHVVKDKTTIRVTLSNGTTNIGHVLWAGVGNHDVALIAVNTDGIRPAKIDCERHGSGYPVLGFGNPLGVHNVATRGYIASNEDLREDGVAEGSRVLDLTINPGNSGGGIYGPDGHLIGIADAVLLTPFNMFSASLSGLSIMVESPVICRMLAR